MLDREKIIKAFDDEKETLAWLADDEFSSFEYSNGYKSGLERGKTIVLNLLKKQEAVEPKKADNPEESEYCCGICGYPLWLDELYCAHCGERIKWNVL